MDTQSAKEGPLYRDVIKSMGLVFGDIGTSPIYTLTVIFLFTEPTPENVLGILSLIVWTLIILVTIEYAWLAMSLGHKGEGGTIVLKEILVRLLKPGRFSAFMILVSYVGVSLLLGDGVITPAISILSAVEGMLLIPGLENMPHGALVLIAASIAVGLFLFQFKGTDRVASAFGPIMVAWFAALAVSGLVSIAYMPGIIKAVSPFYAVDFFMRNGLSGFFVLSEVVLCATGGEALYADMGHFGREPILKAWYLVFTALVINYLGQGAFAIANPGMKNMLFSMVRWEAPLLYIPFLILTVLATVIASQALISGVFSIVYQGINTRILPLIKVDHTSTHIKSQIYISFVNWLLMVLVILMMLIFEKSENLSAAYGLAVTGTMTITGVIMTIIFAHSTKKRWRLYLAALVTIVDAAFLFASLNKFSHGGYWSFIIALIPFISILVWTSGQRALYRAMRPMDMGIFRSAYEQIYAENKNIPGTALFFLRDWKVVPRFISHCIVSRNIIYERNVFISITRNGEPFGLETRLMPDIGSGLDVFEIKAGYMEVLDIKKLLKENGIREKVIFYGVEEIATTGFAWRIFAFIKKISPNFMQFYDLPSDKLQGVVTRVEI